MENCLVKTLNGRINNDALPKLGSIEAKFWTGTFDFSKGSGNMVTAKILSGLGSFYVNNVSVGDEVSTTQSIVSLKDITSGITTVEFDLEKNRTLHGAIPLDKMQYSPVLYFLFCEQGNASVDGQQVHVNSTGDINSLQGLLPELRKFECTYHASSVTGDITTGLSDCLALEIIKLNNTGQVTGSIETFAAAQVAKGRTAGKLDITCNGTVTFNGSAVSNNTVKSIYYGSSMQGEGINPTSAETSQGWCVR